MIHKCLFSLFYNHNKIIMQQKKFRKWFKSFSKYTIKMNPNPVKDLKKTETKFLFKKSFSCNEHVVEMITSL